MEVIDLCDNDDDEVAHQAGHAKHVLGQSLAAFRRSYDSQRFDANRSFIDLTEDEIPSAVSQASPKRPRPKSPPRRRNGIALSHDVQLRLGSQSTRTRISAARENAITPVVPSSDSEEELPDDPVSSLPRRVSRPSAKALENFRSGSSQPTSSPNKRTRETPEDLQASSPSKKRRAAEDPDSLRSEGSAQLRREISRTASSQPSNTNSAVVPESADDTPTQASPGGRSSKESPTKHRSKHVTSRSSSRTRYKSPRSGGATDDLERDPGSKQTAPEAPASEPLMPTQKSHTRENAIASSPIRKTKNRTADHSVAKSATPLRKVSNAGSASAGDSPSSQLQREVEEDVEPPKNIAQSPPEAAEDPIAPVGGVTKQHQGATDHESAQDLPDDVEARALETGVSTEQQPGETEILASPDWSVFPVELQVERILGKYYQEMREDTDYFTKATLKRCRRSIELYRPKRDETPPIKKASSSQQSVASAVFARLRRATATSITTAIAKTGDGSMKLNVDVYNGASKPARIHFKVKATTCNTSILANDVPEYAHYVSLKSNILAPNSTTMTVWPYFGDGEPDSEEFESVYHMDTDQRHRKIRRLLEAQKVEEYVNSVLQDLEISWDDVLRFLFERNPKVGTNKVAQTATKNRHSYLEDFPKIDGSSIWQKVLASLSSSPPDRLVKAAILCDNFQRMAKFPLWHVARRCATVKQAFSSDEKPPATVTSRICRLCFQFNCHRHGELREHDSDSDSGFETDDAVAKDILYPPRVNFRKRLSLPESRARPEPEDGAASVASLLRFKKKNPRYWETADYLRPGEWPPFYPCWHPGKSCAEANCTCVSQKRPCGKSCGCASDCPRKFEGCACSSKKQRKPGDFTCYRDDRCACYKIGAECDPDLCGACGVCEVLDPVHRHDPPVSGPKRLCHNAGIQKGVPKHTLLGDSGVHGMGLYAGERIEEHDFVGEYKGEIITRQEADRRGAVYEKQNSTYLFYLNPEQEVDSNFFGNKIRFINHRNEGANIYPLIRQVNTVDRIGLFAKAPIKPGEELFFDYGPKFPEHLLGGEQAASSKTAPHVRNADALKDFYDVEEEEDEVGNRRAKKATSAKKRGRPRKAEPSGKPVKPKSKMGGARPGAGRKPGKKKAAPEKVPDAIVSSRVNHKDDHEDEDLHTTAQDRLQAYYVSEDVILEQNGGEDDFDDDEFVDEEASVVESSEDEIEYEGRRRARGKPRKIGL